MIRGVHTMFYSSEPEALRAFLRDKLGFPHTDVGDGWLIFDLPEADMGCHPAAESGGQGAPSGTHDVSFYCDDLERTMNQLAGRGVEFSGGGLGRRIRPRDPLRDAGRRPRPTLRAQVLEGCGCLSGPRRRGSAAGKSKGV